MNVTLALLVLPLLSAPPETKAIVELAGKPLLECDTKVLLIAANEKGTLLLVGTEQGEVGAWNVTKSAFAWRNPPLHALGTLMRGLGVGDKFAFVSRGEPSASAIDVATGKETSGYMALQLDLSVPMVDLRCDPKDRWVWIAFENGVLGRLTPGSPSAYSRRSLKDVKVSSIAYDADASLVAVGSAKGTIHFVNSSSANVDDDKVFKGPESPVGSLDFASKGTLLLAGNEKGEVVVWTVATGKQKQTVKTGDAALTRIVVHPKNKWFATGDATGLVKAWSVDKGEPLATFKADGAVKVFDLEFVDGGKSLVGALGGKSIVTWDVSKL